MSSISYNYSEDLDFSNHAKIRLAERSSMSEDELNLIVQKNKSVPLGIENNRRHELLYSTIDNEYYVIIYDYVVGSVVTFIPSKYHDNIAWKISDDALMLAKNMALEEEIIENKFDESSIIYDPASDILPSVLRFKLKINLDHANKSNKWIQYPTISIQYGLSKKEVHDSIFTTEIVDTVIDSIQKNRQDILNTEELLKSTSITFLYGKEYIVSVDLHAYIQNRSIA